MLEFNSILHCLKAEEYGLFLILTAILEREPLKLRIIFLQIYKTS